MRPFQSGFCLREYFPIEIHMPALVKRALPFAKECIVLLLIVRAAILMILCHFIVVFIWLLF